jgi:hypothetical protein
MFSAMCSGVGLHGGFQRGQNAGLIVGLGCGFGDFWSIMAGDFSAIARAKIINP